MTRAKGGKKISPAGTKQAWIASYGQYPHLLELYCCSSREEVVAYVEKRSYANRRGIRVTSVHLICLGGNWHKVNVNPVKCDVPFEKPKATKSPDPKESEYFWGNKE